MVQMTQTICHIHVINTNTYTLTQSNATTDQRWKRRLNSGKAHRIEYVYNSVDRIRTGLGLFCIPMRLIRAIAQMHNERFNIRIQRHTQRSPYTHTHAHIVPKSTEMMIRETTKQRNKNQIYFLCVLALAGVCVCVRARLSRSHFVMTNNFIVKSQQLHYV